MYNGWTSEPSQGEKQWHELQAIQAILADDPHNPYWLARLASLTAHDSPLAIPAGEILTESQWRARIHVMTAAGLGWLNAATAQSIEHTVIARVVVGAVLAAFVGFDLFCMWRGAKL